MIVGTNGIKLSHNGTAFVCATDAGVGLTHDKTPLVGLVPASRGGRLSSISLQTRILRSNNLERRIMRSYNAGGESDRLRGRYWTGVTVTEKCTVKTAPA
jgi:hypothetical protein